MMTRKSTNSRASILPHWDGNIYTYAANFYETVTRLTGWKRKLETYALEGLPPAQLLDVGCGPGFLLNLAQQRGHTIYGIDPSVGMIKKAKSIYDLSKPTVQVASAESLPFKDETFDAVLASGALVHIPNVEKALNEALRVLRPSGVLRILDHAPPKKRNWKTPLALAFSHLSGDIIHDYEAILESQARLIRHQTIGRGGLLQKFDFCKAYAS